MHKRMQDADGRMPQAQDYMLRHQCTAYNTFFDVFVKRVVGVRKFERHATKHLLSEFVTVTDEAFALLVYENQEDRWRIMAEDSTRKLVKEAKYTDGGGGKDLPMSGKTRKGKGWSSSGMQRFNELCLEIHKERTSVKARSKFEKDYRKHKREELLNKKRKGSRKKDYDDDDSRPPQVFNEMDREPFCPTAEDFQDAGTDSSGSEDDDGDNETVISSSYVGEQPAVVPGLTLDPNGQVGTGPNGQPVDENGNDIRATSV